MAYGARRLNPVVLEQRRALGVKLPFSLRNGEDSSFRGVPVFTSTYQTKDAVRSNIMNYFLTARGERYFHLSFGNELLNSLFEHDTPELRTVILEQTRRDLQMYFPQIKILSLTLEDVDEHAIQLCLNYLVYDSKDAEELVINLAQ